MTSAAASGSPLPKNLNMEQKAKVGRGHTRSPQEEVKQSDKSSFDANQSHCPGLGESDSTPMLKPRRPQSAPTYGVCSVLHRTHSRLWLRDCPESSASSQSTVVTLSVISSGAQIALEEEPQFITSLPSTVVPTPTITQPDTTAVPSAETAETTTTDFVIREHTHPPARCLEQDEQQQDRPELKINMKEAARHL